jgi:hypothetical protein
LPDYLQYLIKLFVMEEGEKKFISGGLKLILSTLLLLFLTGNVFATTYDWIGGTSTVASNANNWYNETTQLTNSGVPGSADNAYIGVNSTYVVWILYPIVGLTTNINLTAATMPVVTANATWGSLTFGYYGPQGTYTYGVNEALSLSVNTGITLTVSGNVTQNHNASATGSTFNYIATTISGAGTLLCQGNFLVGDATTQPGHSVAEASQVSIQINQLTISGNLVLNSNGNTTTNDICYPWFSLEKGTTTLLKQIIFTKNNSPLADAFDNYNLPLSTYPGYGKFSADNTSSSASTLELKYKQPVVPADKFYVYFTYGGNNGTVLYDDPTAENQTIYTANEPSVTTTTTYINTTAPPYYNVTFSGASTKLVDKNSVLGSTTQGLTVGNNLITSGGAVNLNTNNPTVTVSGSWTNSCNVTQGSGNITITNALQNTAGTFQLGTGNLTTSTLQNSGGTVAGGAGPGVVTVSGTFQNNGGTFQCNAENDYFNGLYQNTSTFTAGTGTVYFNGSAAQSLSDISSAGTQFNNVSFSGTSLANPKTMSGSGGFSVSPTGFLYMVGSTTKLVAGTATVASLTLKSDTTGTATVTNIPSGSVISGFVTVQRFVQGNKTYDAVAGRWIGRNYRLMSSPVNEGVDASSNYPCSLNYLGASTIITDCTSTYASKGGNPSLYLYNEHYTPSNASFISGNFIGVTNISNTAASGTVTTTDATNGTGKVYAGGGYMIYFRGDNITHLSGSPNKTTYPYVAPESVTFSTTGNLNQGTYAVVSWTGTAGLMYTTSNAGNSTVRGYNLAGNPYASSIDWSTFSNSNAAAPIYGKNVNPTVYIFNPTTSQYASYNASTGVVANGGSKTIPSGQGFFVQANNTSPTLTFNESAKTNTVLTGSNLLMGTPASQLAYTSFMKLTLVTDSINKDEMVIGFNSSSTTKYNSNEDSAFLPGSSPPESIAGISSDSVQTTAKWLPFPGNTTCQVLKLYVTARATGTYTIQRTDLEAIPQIYDLWLKDNYKKDSLDIRNNTTYVFDIDLTDTASYGSNRFEIVVRQNPALSIHLLNFTASKTTGGSQIVWKTENEQNYTNFTVERSNDGGATFVVLGGFTSSALGTYSYLDKNPPVSSDMYRLQIQDLNGTITYSNMVTLIYGNSNRVAASNISVYPNPSNGLLNLAINQTSSSTQQPGLSTLQNIASTPSLTATQAANTSYNIEIISITGSVIKSATTTTTSWQDNVSSLTPGTYIIQVVNNKDKSVVGKSTFVKM